MNSVYLDHYENPLPNKDASKLMHEVSNTLPHMRKRYDIFCKKILYKLCDMSPDEFEIIFTSGQSESNTSIIYMVALGYWKHMKTKGHILISAVEDEDMIRAMAERDIRFMQGYFFSQPKSVEDTEKLFKSSPWSADEFSRITRN